MLALTTTMSQASAAQVREPDAKNGLTIKANPTATVKPVCHRLDQREYSQAFHAACYSEFKKTVVILVSGNAKGVSGKRVGQIISNEFAKKYVPAVVFLENPERHKVSITYLLNGDPYGPYSGHNWSDGLKLVAVHAGQAWYPKLH